MTPRESHWPQRPHSAPSSRSAFGMSGRPHSLEFGQMSQMSRRSVPTGSSSGRPSSIRTTDAPSEPIAAR